MAISTKISTVTIDGHITLDVWRAEKQVNRTRLTLWDTIYKDIDGDGMIDGFHQKHRNEMLILGQDFVAIQNCDWENGVANPLDDTGQEYRFENGQWRKSAFKSIKSY